MSNETNKPKLPNGEWLYLKGLPLGTTPEELSGYFCEHGLRIGPDCISIKEFVRVSCAIVSVQPQCVLDLFRWALEGVPPFDGKFHFGVEIAQHRKKRAA